MRQSNGRFGILCQHALVITLLALVLGLGVGKAKAAGEQDVQKFIQDLAQKAITTVAVQDISDDERRARFERLFISSFDIPEIGKFVLSRYWRAATPAQQQQFLKEFEEAQVLTWSQRFKGYNGVNLTVLGAAHERDDIWLVDSRINRPQGPPIPVQWRVHRGADGTLRIIDIIPEGVSMALTYRQDYASVLQQNGGKIDALLATMRAKNQQLATAPTARKP